MTDATPLARPRLVLPAWALFALGVLSCGVAIWSEGSISGQDEYWLSFRTPMEMRARGEYWTPWLDGEPRLQKPPLLYWLLCLSYELLGTNLFAARIWSACFGAGLALIAARLHRELWQRDGTLAGLLVLAAAGVGIESRRAMLDLPMGCLAALAVLLGLRWQRSGRLAPLLGASSALAAAVLMKGPVALLFAATATFAWWITQRRAPRAADTNRSAARLPQLMLATLFFLALALPWPISMWLSWPQLGDVLVEQSEARQFTWLRVSAIGPVLGGGLALIAPWSLVVLHAAVRAPGIASDDERRTRRWLLLWVLASAVPFLCFAAFERYLIPMVVPMAVLAARFLESCDERVRRVHLTLAVAVLGLPTLGFATFALVFELAILTPLAAIALLAWTLRSAWRHAEPRRVALACAASITLLLGGVYPAIGINALPDDLPTDLREKDVATYQIAQPGMLSMRAGKSVFTLPEGIDLKARLAGFDGYVFVLEDRRERFLSACEAAAIEVQALRSFRSLFSRKAWLRFVREGSTWADWREALAARSLDALSPEFTIYRVRHG
jgi:4-amino-4-deoxy-L-arabinose transferase-like glycosyltransferase